MLDVWPIKCIDVFKMGNSCCTTRSHQYIQVFVSIFTKFIILLGTNNRVPKYTLNECGK